MLVSSSVKKQPKKVDQLGESTKKCVVLRVGKGGGGLNYKQSAAGI